MSDIRQVPPSGILVSASQHLRFQAAEWLQRALATRRKPDGRKWTRTDLAKEAGIVRQTIWSILEQRSDPQLDTIRSLARVLGVPIPAFMLGGGEDEGLAVFEVEMAKVRGEVDNYDRAGELVPPKILRVWLDNLEHARGPALPTAPAIENAVTSKTRQRP